MADNKIGSPKPVEQSFNESELDEIMSEIEDLEKDFSDGPPKPAKPDPIAEEMDAASIEAMELEVNEILDVEPSFSEAEVEPVQAPSFEDSLSKELGICEPATFKTDLKIAADVAPKKTKMQEEIDSEVLELLEDSVNVSEEKLSIVSESFVSPTEEGAVEEKVVAMKSHPSSKPVSDESPHKTEMDFSLCGDVSMKINFRFSGKNVELHVDSKNGFFIEMDNGIRFQIPLDPKEWKKAS